MHKTYVIGNFFVEGISRGDLPLRAFYIQMAAISCFFFFQIFNFSLNIKRSFSIGIFLLNLTGANVQSLKGVVHCSDIDNITPFWLMKKAFKAFFFGYRFQLKIRKGEKRLS